MRVKQLASELGVSVDNVRYYTRIGFLVPSKSINGYKHYRPEDIAKLRFILSARSLGFSVNDIEEILNMASHDKVPCPTVRRLIEIRLAETERRFQDMLELRERMRKATEEWQLKPDQLPTAQTICHLIEGFSLIEE
ncbi:MerR family transcriptional regulator [Alteromonas mediterranea]|uniref:MerR family transcriptional regulator n=1 Tax=Alteromonas mediterranea TaxID=314275 RepID=UPI002FE16C79